MFTLFFSCHPGNQVFMYHIYIFSSLDIMVERSTSWSQPLAYFLLMLTFNILPVNTEREQFTHFCNEVEEINLRISILITSREIIYSLPSCFRIEEANYDGSCRRIIIAFYAGYPQYLIFYNNTLYWGNYYSGIWQTSRTTGDSAWFVGARNRIADSGIVTEDRNGNLELTFSTNGPATLNWN